MSDVATALLQLTGRPEPATADPALAAVKLARASIDALILRLGQTIDAKVTAQLAGGLTQLTAGGENFVLKLETPLPVNTAVTLRIAATPNGQRAVTVTVQPQPIAAQPTPPAPLPATPLPQPVTTMPQPVATMPLPVPTSTPALPQLVAAPPALPSKAPVVPAPSEPTVPQAASGQAMPAPNSPPATMSQVATPTPLPSPAGQPTASPQPPPASLPPAATAPPAPQPAATPAAPLTSTPIAVPAATPLHSAAPVMAALPIAAATTAAPSGPATAAGPVPTPPAAPPPASGTAPIAPPQPGATTPAAPVSASLPLPAPAPATLAPAPASTTPVAPQTAAATATVPQPVLTTPPAPLTLRPAAPPPTSPPLTQILADPVQAAARQDSVLPLIARLAALTSPAVAALPRPALEAIARILAGRLDLNRAPPDGKSIRDAVLRAGVVTEPGTRVPTDAKSALLQLRSALSGFLGGEVEAIAPITRRPPPPLKGEPVRAPSPQQAGPSIDEPVDTARQLLGHTDAALSRLKLLQLASNPSDTVRPNAPAPAAEFRVEVPMQLGAETGILQLLVERDGKHKRTPAERGWRMRFALNFTVTGEVGAEIALLGRSANVALWAAEPATADALETMLPELAPALARHGLDVGSIRVRRGAPQPPVRAPGQLLDSAR